MHGKHHHALNADPVQELLGRSVSRRLQRALQGAQVREQSQLLHIQLQRAQAGRCASLQLQSTRHRGKDKRDHQQPHREQECAHTEQNTQAPVIQA